MSRNVDQKTGGSQKTFGINLAFQTLKVNPVCCDSSQTFV